MNYAYIMLAVSGVVGVVGLIVAWSIVRAGKKADANFGDDDQEDMQAALHSLRLALSNTVEQRDMLLAALLRTVACLQAVATPRGCSDETIAEVADRALAVVAKVEGGAV